MRWCHDMVTHDMVQANLWERSHLQCWQGQKVGGALSQLAFHHITF